MSHASHALILSIPGLRTEDLGPPHAHCGGGWISSAGR
jgi:hypothetical protein